MLSLPCPAAHISPCCAQRNFQHFSLVLQEIRDHVTDEHLLQFAAAAADDADALAAATALALPLPWADDGCLMGAADEPEACGTDFDTADWELVMDREEGGLRYRVWRQLLRKGLYMYRAAARFADISAADLRPFHLDDDAR